MVTQGLNKPGERERWIVVTTGCAPPVAEDWCLPGNGVDRQASV